MLSNEYVKWDHINWSDSNEINEKHIYTVKYKL